MQATHGFLRTANPHRVGAQGPFTSTVADGAFAFVDYGDGVVGRVSNDSTTILESATIAAHGEVRSAVANGANLGELTLFTLTEDEQDEPEVTALPHARHATIHGNLPAFLELLDTFARSTSETLAFRPSPTAWSLSTSSRL